MRTLAVVGTIALLLAGTAMGQSTITYTLEIGGDNHVADWENPSMIVTTPFTNGSATPGVQQGPAPVTWNVVAACSGTHSSDSMATQGIANVVFNLTLKDSGGNVVTTTEWTSTMNDGDMQGARRSLAGTPDPLEKAAWCLGWDVDMNEDGVLDGLGGTGRIFDPASASGPYMDRVQFPSTVGFGGGRMAGGEGGYVAVGATTTTVDAGVLLGMGVGYSQFVYGQNSLGVGLALFSQTPNWNPFILIGLGTEPLAEGQIDMSALPGGTYTLELTVPKDTQNNPMGQNIILGGYNPQTATGGFAAKADAVVEDSVSFVWDPGVIHTKVEALAWASFKTHTASGSLYIPLDPASAVGVVETRTGGLTQVKVVFDAALTEASNYFPAAVAVSPALAVTPSLATTNVANDTLVLSFTGSTDLKCHKIDLSTAILWKDAVAADAKDCLVRVQFGNVSGDAWTNLTDAANTKAKNSSAVVTQGANVPFDVSLDGYINLTDVANIKAKNSSQTTTACP